MKGIGPRRAAYIEAYRQEVGPIRNTLDLATATGLSLKTAEKLSSQIDWQYQDTVARIHLPPLIITCLATAWLLLASFREITAPVTSMMDLIFRLSLGAVLLGALIATLDVALASARRETSETTGLFKPGGSLLIAGFVVLSGLLLAGPVTEVPDDLKESLHRSFHFVVACLLMAWLIYGPALSLRVVVARFPKRIGSAQQLYDLSLVPFSAGCIAILAFANGPTLLEEIFSTWSLAVLISNALELRKGKSAFPGMLSKLDRARCQFYLRHQVSISSEGKSRARTMGYLVIFLCVVLLAAIAREMSERF